MANSFFNKTKKTSGFLKIFKAFSVCDLFLFYIDKLKKKEWNYMKFIKKEKE